MSMTNEQVPALKLADEIERWIDTPDGMHTTTVHLGDLRSISATLREQAALIAKAESARVFLGNELQRASNCIADLTAQLAAAREEIERLTKAEGEEYATNSRLESSLAAARRELAEAIAERDRLRAVCAGIHALLTSGGQITEAGWRMIEQDLQAALKESDHAK